MAGRGSRDGPLRVRLRPVRVLPGRRRPGVPAADSAGIHRAGLLRRTGGGPRGGREPDPGARRGRLRRGCLPWLPVRDRLPRGDCARPGPGRRVAGGARLRRGRAVGGADRRGPRGPRGGDRRGRPGAEPGPPARRRVCGRRGCLRPGRRDRRDHGGRSARLGRRARITGHRSLLGALPAAPRQARPGRAAARRADAHPDGPGRGAGTGGLRLARHGRPRLPADDGPGRGRHAAPRAAGRPGDRPGGGRPGAGRDGRPCGGRRDDGDQAAGVVVTGGRRASRPSSTWTRRRGWSGRGCRPGPASARRRAPRGPGARRGRSGPGGPGRPPRPAADG